MGLGRDRGNRVAVERDLGRYSRRDSVGLAMTVVRNTKNRNNGACG
jgi:hypothetical protein